MGSDDIRVHVATATQAADAVNKVRDYRGKYVHLGVAGVHALAALAISLDKFAAAITPPQENQ